MLDIWEQMDGLQGSCQGMISLPPSLGNGMPGWSLPQASLTWTAAP